jgi:transposase
MLEEKKVYIGIDVSKSILDVFILPSNKHMQFKNEANSIQKLLTKLRAFPEPLVVMESTGGYEKPLAYALSEASFNVCIINPRQVRDFAKALGKLAKTDKIDAQVIALFANKMEPQANVVYDKEHQLLSDNNARRRQLVDMIKMEKNRLDKASSSQQESIERVLEVLEKELKIINKAQEKTIQENPKYSEKKKILESVAGIGTITAVSILAEIPELGQIGSKQIASLSGLAPFNRDSGGLKGKRAIWGGRASIRTSLYMATLVAIRHNPRIKLFYERLCLAGKAKKVSIIACMRKLLIIINAMIKNGQSWDAMRAA